MYDLEKLGLSEYESKAYVALLKCGSLNTNQLSKESGVPQSKIYDALYKLSQKNFVQVLDVRPKLFQANEPKKAIALLIRSRTAELEKMEKSISDSLVNLKKVNPLQSKTNELVSIYKGTEMSKTLSLNNYKSAKRYVKDMYTFELIPTDAFTQIRRAIARGVHIKMIATKMGDKQMELIKKMSSAGVDVRYYPVGDIRISVMDGTQSLQVIVNPDDFYDRFIIAMESPGMVKALEYYFDYIWKRAKQM